MNIETSPEKNPRMTQTASFEGAQFYTKITQFYFIYSSIYYAKIFSLNHNASTGCEKNYHAKFGH